MANEDYREPCKHWNVRFAHIVLSFWMIILNLQSFGEGLDLCFDQSKGGWFLTSLNLPKFIKNI
jgi:hypothetical protein